MHKQFSCFRKARKATCVCVCSSKRSVFRRRSTDWAPHVLEKELWTTLASLQGRRTSCIYSLGGGILEFVDCGWVSGSWSVALESSYIILSFCEWSEKSCLTIHAHAGRAIELELLNGVLLKRVPSHCIANILLSQNSERMLNVLFDDMPQQVVHASGTVVWGIIT